jgi:hypothetical protein
LHANPQVLLTHVACAFATPVVQTLPQLPQLLTLVPVSTQVPSHSAGALAGHPDKHVDPEQTGLPASAVHACPHEPQLLLSLLVSTHAPPQEAYGLLHEKPHEPLTQSGCALATSVEQEFPHVPQLLVSLVVSTHVPPHSDGADAVQPETQAYEPASPGAHTGPSSALHACPQAPQFAAVVSSTQAPLQRVYPWLHETVQALSMHAGCAFGSDVVQTRPHCPQLVAVLVVSTQDPLQFVEPVGHSVRQEYAPPVLAQRLAVPVHAWPHCPQLAVLA